MFDVPLSVKIDYFVTPFLERQKGHCVHVWKYIFVSACKVLGEEFPDLAEADIQVVLDCHATELTEEYIGQVTALTESED